MRSDVEFAFAADGRRSAGATPSRYHRPPAGKERASYPPVVVWFMRIGALGCVTRVTDLRVMESTTVR
jgi:hypothetical protein